MSISIATNGMLWPKALIFHEYYSSIETVIVDPYDISIVVDDVIAFETTVQADEVSSDVTLLDTITGEVLEINVSGSAEGCD